MDSVIVTSSNVSIRGNWAWRITVVISLTALADWLFFRGSGVGQPLPDGRGSAGKRLNDGSVRSIAGRVARAHTNDRPCLARLVGGQAHFQEVGVFTRPQRFDLCRPA